MTYLNIIAELKVVICKIRRGYFMGRRRRRGRPSTLLHLLAPGHHYPRSSLIRDVALGAFIAREIIKE